MKRALFALVGALVGLCIWNRLRPRPLTVETLVCSEPMVGTNIAAAAEHAEELASDEADFAVQFTFNEVEIVVMPGAKAAQIAAAYREALEAGIKRVTVRPA